MFTPRRLKHEHTLRDEAVQQAYRAYREGHRVFVFALPSGESSPGHASWMVWQDIVQRIEAEGWRLEHWSVVGAGPDDCTAFPLFRRESRER